jgi:hypothetical protein
MAGDPPSALFVREEGGYRPTRLSGSPWSPDALHGGPPAALLAREIERFEDGESFRVARVTVELLRPVPLERLEASAHLRRPGRNVQEIEVTLRGPDHEVARAAGLRIRRGAIHLPDEAVDRTPPPPGPSQGKPREPLSPLCRACAAADFGNGISSLLPDTHTYINPDLTVYLHRYPEGEWICLDAVTRIQTDGIGLAESRLFDERGPIGTAMQSLIVAERPTEPNGSA